MADLAQVEAAFLKADAAGDTEAAGVLAEEVRRLRSEVAVPSKPTLLPEQIAEQKQRATKSMIRAERGTARNILGDVVAGAGALGGKILDIPSKMFDAPWMRSEASIAQDTADKGSGAYLVGGLLDPIAQAVGSGAFAAASRAPAIPKVAEATSTYLKNIAAGGATGAGLSAAQGGDAAEGGLFGAGITAALGSPALAKVVSNMSGAARNVGNSLWATLSKGGRASIGQKMVLDQLQPAEKDAVLKILSTKGVDVSELGQPLTTAQTLGQARIGQQVKAPAGARVAALESEISKMPGGENLNAIAAAQQGASREMMGTLSGGRNAPIDPLIGMSADDIALAKVKAARTATAQKLYPQGEVSGDRALNEIMDRPAVTRALGIEERSAGNVPRATQIGKDTPAKTVYQGVFTDWQQTPYKEDMPEQFAKYSIKSLQNQYRLMEKEVNRLMKSPASTDETLGYELREAKNALGAWLSEKSPEWAQANRIFAFQSVPANQMKVGTALSQKMEQSPEAFLKATEAIPAQERLIRQATGRPNQQLSDMFNLGQMSKISGLRNASQITGEVQELQKLAKANLGDERAFQLPNLLNVWVAVANKLARETAKSTVDDVTREAAKVLADPALLRELLSKDAARRAAIARPMSTARMAPIVGGASNIQGMMSGANQ
jgi:hypothetical protein